MPWQLVAPNQWKNDRSDFTIKFDEAYGSYIVESVDGRFSIPFDDIFNNPVYPIDLSQVTVLGKHFRAEAVNTPGTPGFSFQGDANTGFYRVSEDVMGGAVGGNKVLEINTLGLLNGNPGTDFRNTIKRQYGQIGSGQPGNSTTSILSSGFGFSYTPLRSDSLLNIRFFLSTRVSYGSIPVTNTNTGFLYIYSHTSIPSAGSTALGTQKNKYILGYGGLYSSYAYENLSHGNFNLLELSGNLNTRSYYLGFNSAVSGGFTGFNPNNDPSINMGYIIEEYI